MNSNYPTFELEKRVVDKKEGEKLLREYVDNAINTSGWWIFGKRKINLSFTRVLEPYEKEANLPLPESIRIRDFTIDNTGISTNGEVIRWTEVCVSAIETETTYNDQKDEFEYVIRMLIVLNNNKIIGFTLGDISSYKGLLGHFIELYKLG